MNNPAPSTESQVASSLQAVVRLVEYAIEEDVVLAARRAIESGVEYARMMLDEHERELGRTTLKNRVWAEQMENDIEDMLSALAMMPRPDAELSDGAGEKR